MLATKLIIIYTIIPLCSFAMPINDAERKALKTVLKALDKKITAEIQWRQTNSCENPKFADELEISQKVKNLLKKLKISGEDNEIKNETDKLFEMVEGFLDKIIENMEQMLQTLEAYSPRMRFEMAFEEEMKSPRKCTVTFGQNVEIARIHAYVDQNRLERIQAKLSKLFILHKMGMPKNEKAYCQYFETYYYKKQDLERELRRTNSAICDYEYSRCATTELWEETTEKYCYEEDWRGRYECSECWLFCLPCWCTSVVLGSIVTVPMDLCRCARMGIGKCKSAQIKAELAKIEAKKAQIPQLDTSTHE